MPKVLTVFIGNSLLFKSGIKVKNSLWAQPLKAPSITKVFLLHKKHTDIYKGKISCGLKRKDYMED